MPRLNKWVYPHNGIQWDWDDPSMDINIFLGDIIPVKWKKIKKNYWGWIKTEIE